MVTQDTNLIELITVADAIEEVGIKPRITIGKVIGKGSRAKYIDGIFTVKVNLGKYFEYILVTAHDSAFFNSIIGPNPDYQRKMSLRYALSHNVEQALKLHNYHRFKSFQPLVEYRRPH